MDTFTTQILLSASMHNKEVADVYKELSSGGGNPPSVEQIKWFNTNQGKYVNVGAISSIT